MKEEEFIVVEEEDCIAKRRERRVIKPPSRSAKSAFAHALSIAEETYDARELNSFSEVISS